MADRTTSRWAITVDDDGWTYPADTREDALQAFDEHWGEQANLGEIDPGVHHLDAVLYTQAVWIHRPAEGEYDREWEDCGVGDEHDSMMVDYATRERLSVRLVMPEAGDA